MSQITFSSKKPIQPLFPYTDRSVQSILVQVDRRLRGTGISIQSIEPFIFENSEKSHRLSNQDKFVIYNKVDRLIQNYTSPPVHLLQSGIMKPQQGKLVFFKEKVQLVKATEKDSEHKFQKIINSYKSDVDKIYSNKFPAEPMYCLNHSINRQKLIQIKDHTGIRAINVHLWNFDFETALDCLSRPSEDHPDKMDIELLTTTIRIFRNISQITSMDNDLKKRFFQRRCIQIVVPREVRNEDVSIPHILLSEDISQADLEKINKLSTGVKIYLLKKFLDYGITLAKQMLQIAKTQPDKKNSCLIPYLFLSNNIDTPNYAIILQHPHLKQIDKFFFAFKFLKNTKFQQYKIKLQRKLQQSSDLLEIGLCNNLRLQAKIMQNYIDDVGDIKTIAILAVYEKIKMGYQKKSEMDDFIEKYQNMLTQFNQQTKLQEFQNKIKELRQKHRTSGKDSRKDSVLTNQSTELGEPFLYRLDLINKKIKALVPRKQYNRFCWICRTNAHDYSLKSKGFAQDFYAQCEKCHHGGHFKHLLLWFQNNIRCPVADCSCCCN